MKLVLTPQLLKFLSAKGYQYCLSRITHNSAKHGEELMLLIPLRRRPSMQIINNGYDALFTISGEPARLADEPGRLLVLVQIDTSVILKYLKTLLQAPKKEKPITD